VQIVSRQTGAGELSKDTTAETEKDTLAISLCSVYQYTRVSSVCRVVAYL
jgi:hypothetical protein